MGSRNFPHANHRKYTTNRTHTILPLLHERFAALSDGWCTHVSRGVLYYTWQHCGVQRKYGAQCEIFSVFSDKQVSVNTRCTVMGWEKNKISVLG